jgi:hypothetical protein
MAGLQLQAICYPPSSAVPGAIGHLVVETGWKEGLEKRASGRHALPHTQHSLSLETQTTPSVGKTVNLAACRAAGCAVPYRRASMFMPKMVAGGTSKRPKRQRFSAWLLWRDVV